ncbi:acyltransferase family protein [Bacillus alkalisoli]|uniref:acyltransferase family protein n=1 Tax=Bacillus alkalisoli TaxID=2011008 RepID=UPI000C2336D4|nr:acyltransferase family protein [Bacillus alkalisoli]
MNDLKIPGKKFRPELEGVRAVAAILVAVYHIWLGTVSGGVDVFFIVSGFLITTSLLAKIEKEGKVRYTEYLLGLGRRLFPLAFLVLLVSAVFSFLVLPQLQWRQVIAEIFASGLYVQNWKLAVDAVDYLAQNNSASPLQHFWALSIQGQFYIIWPVVIFLAFLIAQKLFKAPLRKTLLAVLTIIFISSITYSIYITSTNQPWAYFDTFARVWEFSLGGILALLLPYLSLNKWISTIIGWLGLGIILLTGILLPVSTVFPGYAALLPTSGVILIIISAENYAKFGVKRLLGSKFFQHFGSFSYGFYLWHWPLLIFYFAYFQVETVSLRDGIIILLLTYVLSLVTTRVLESPVRHLSVRHSKRKLAIILLSFALPVFVANFTWSVYLDRMEEEMKAQYEIQDYPGARVLYENVEATPGVVPIDTPLDATSRLPIFYADGCYVKMRDRGVKICSYGETENPEYTIALVGGSHSGHWFPALEQFAADLNIRIDVYNKDACRFSTEDFNGLLSDTCMEWNELVIEPLMENKPDLIFTTATVYGGNVVPEGYKEMWRKFEGVTNIFAIRDTPGMEIDIPVCVETNGPEECSVERSGVLADMPPWEDIEGIPDNVYYADLTEYFCDNEVCHAVIGNILVFRDHHHISTLYSMTLAEPLKREIMKALDISKR